MTSNTTTDPSSAVHDGSGAVSGTGAASGKHLALVEDDRLNAKILRRILGRSGYEVTWFENGEALMEALEEGAFDLILLDVVLPGVDGLEVCRCIKASERHAEVPVIFITARSGSEDVVAGFEAGGADYIPKPFQASETLARVRAHLSIRQLNAEQAATIAELDSAVRSRNRLLGVTAHDLRNPLISIRGFGEMLRDGMVGELNEDQKEMAETISSAAASMLTLINDLLDLSAIDTGELNLELEKADLGELLEKTVHLYKGQAEHKRISIVTEPPETAVRCRFDCARMRQVAENLVSNALKFSSPGSCVRMTWGWREERPFFAVRDEGPGIPEAERDRLFEDYGKTSVRPTGGEKSTGLGLAICRKIVEAHDGSIEANNLPDRGCEFCVKLPRGDGVEVMVERREEQ